MNLPNDIRLGNRVMSVSSGNTIAWYRNDRVKSEYSLGIRELKPTHPGDDLVIELVIHDWTFKITEFDARILLALFSFVIEDVQDE